MGTSEPSKSEMGIRLPRHKHLQQCGNYVWLLLKSVVLKPTFEYNLQSFVLKEELHVTLFHLHKIFGQMQVNGWSNDDRGREMLLQSFWRADLRVIDQRVVLSELRVAEEGEAQTIVAFGTLGGLAEVYEQLSFDLGIKLSPPPIHVTLYTLPGQRPIGIADDHELQTLTRILSANQQKWILEKMGLNIPTTLTTE